MSGRYRIGFVNWELTARFCGDACNAIGAEIVDQLRITEPDRISACDLVVVAEEYSSPTTLVLHEARRRRVPTLHVMDGMLEWRNSWENPALRTPFLRPVVSDKVACLGRTQARILESWGNPGKCEIVGAPRLDPLVPRPRTSRPATGRQTLLVMSARTPFFDAGQRELVLRAFSDIKSWLDARAAGAAQAIAVNWRVAPEVADHLRLAPGGADLQPDSLWRQFGAADAVVSTPSTAALEAMLYGLPVAVIDYTNSPQYLASAWTVAARSHLDATIPALLRPAPERLQYQEYVLHEALECRTPAAPRLAALMRAMAEAGRAARVSSSPLSLPDRILSPGEPVAPAAMARGRAADADEGLIQNEIAHWREEARTWVQRVAVPTARVRELEARLARYEHYGCGPLLARLVHTFPYPRRMVRAWRLWRDERAAAPPVGPHPEGGEAK